MSDFPSNLAEAIEQRDLAQSVAVGLEQELAAANAENSGLRERIHEALKFNEGTACSGAAKDSWDCRRCGIRNRLIGAPR